MVLKVSVVVVMVVVVMAAAPAFSLPTNNYVNAESQSPAQYTYNYAVRDGQSGNDFGQNENRQTSNTEGSYFVHLPDGRQQTVNYAVNGDSGFMAEVLYDGEAQYPQRSSSQPQYPQRSSSQPQYPQRSSSKPQYPQRSSSQPQYPQRSSSQPQYPQRSSSQPQYPQRSQSSAQIQYSQVSQYP